MLRRLVSHQWPQPSEEPITAAKSICKWMAIMRSLVYTSPHTQHMRMHIHIYTQHTCVHTYTWHSLHTHTLHTNIHIYILTLQTTHYTLHTHTNTQNFLAMVLGKNGHLRSRWRILLKECLSSTHQSSTSLTFREGWERTLTVHTTKRGARGNNPAWWNKIRLLRTFLSPIWQARCSRVVTIF